MDRGGAELPLGVRRHGVSCHDSKGAPRVPGGGGLLVSTERYSQQLFLALVEGMVVFGEGNEVCKTWHMALDPALHAWSGFYCAVEV